MYPMVGRGVWSMACRTSHTWFDRKAEDGAKGLESSISPTSEWGRGRRE